jgi:hypothetical protein
VLGSDDQNAAHCVYPHNFVVVSPNGGEAWAPGAVESVRWSSTSDGGSGVGTADLDLSLDAGISWTTIAAGTPNDGTFHWTVPALPSTTARLRVVRRTLPGPGTAGGMVCSQDLSNGTFTILPPPGLAGTISEGGAAPLLLTKSPSGEIELTWGTPCGEPTGYAVYAGSLDALRAGTWDHAALRCASASELAEVVPADGPDRYYLVGSVAAAGEGSLGAGSDGKLRPEASSRCAPRTSLRCP